MVEGNGDIRVILLLGCGVVELVDGAVCEGATVDELDFCAGLEDAGDEVFAVLGGKSAEMVVIGLDGANMGFDDIAVDVNALRQDTQRLDFDPDEATIAVCDCSALVIVVVAVGLEGELLREAGVDAGFRHAAELGARNALTDDDGEVALFRAVTTGVFRREDGWRVGVTIGRVDQVIIMGGSVFSRGSWFTSPFEGAMSA